MVKKMAAACAVGALAGIALEYVAAIALSIGLRLGYFLPCLASLPEQMGGEINAVVFQAVACALLGAGIGAAWRLARWKPWPVAKRVLWSVADVAASALMVVGLSVGMAG